MSGTRPRVLGNRVLWITYPIGEITFQSDPLPKLTFFHYFPLTKKLLIGIIYHTRPSFSWISAIRTSVPPDRTWTAGHAMLHPHIRRDAVAVQGRTAAPQRTRGQNMTWPDNTTRCVPRWHAQESQGGHLQWKTHKRIHFYDGPGCGNGGCVGGEAERVGMQVCLHCFSRPWYESFLTLKFRWSWRAVVCILTTENPTEHNVCERRGRTAASQPQSYIYIEGSQSLDVEATGGHLRVTDGETERNLTSHSFVCYYQDTRWY